jgi:hypothetical protein
MRVPAASGVRPVLGTRSAASSPTQRALTPRPLGNATPFNVTPVAYHNASNFSWVASGQRACWGSIGFNQSADPSLVDLANDSVGVAFDESTNRSSNAWSSAGLGVTRSQVSWSVGFSVSTDGGSPFGPTTIISNETCPYIDALQPSLAVSNGTVLEEAEFAPTTARSGTTASSGTAGLPLDLAVLIALLIVGLLVVVLVGRPRQRPPPTPVETVPTSEVVMPEADPWPAPAPQWPWEKGDPGRPEDEDDE